jgi:hypothetical protein
MKRKRSGKGEQPMQPFIKDEQGIVRFRENAIVRDLVDGKIEGSLNEIYPLVHAGTYTMEDYRQLMQLIGYSLCGYHELSCVKNKHAKAATEAAQKVFPGVQGCRDTGCPVHNEE